MNWDEVEGNWKQLKGAVKEKWGKLTDDDLDMIAGNRDKSGRTAARMLWTSQATCGATV
jgi:uncharacterized protein YjbJ (UPF0337 family)